MVTLVIVFGSFGFCDLLKFIYLFFAAHGFSLVLAGGGYALAAVWGLLIVVVSLAEHRLQGM